LVVTNSTSPPPTPPPPGNGNGICPFASLYSKLGNLIASILGSKWRVKAYSTEAQPEKAVGLLFAGSSNTTIINPIQEVVNALGIVI
jgi:hypothetical protein